MAPAVGRNMRAIMEGRFSPEVADTLRLWVGANWARLGLELCGTLCALRALAARPAPDAREESAGVSRVHGAATAAGRV